MDKLLTIGEFSRRSMLSIKALRLYDRRQVLIPAYIDPDSGYRHYQESQLEAARLIVQLRRLEMPLNEIRDLLELDDSARAVHLQQYWESTERRLAMQRELVSHIWVQLSGNHGDFPAFDVQLRRVPECTYLTDRRHVSLTQLEDFVRGGLSQLRELARELGGQNGNHLVIYHGLVSEDSDGPVELAIPITPPTAFDGSHSIWTEPEHVQAFLQLNAAQSEYPQILSAYDAVLHWIDSQQLLASGPQREIYPEPAFDSSSIGYTCEVAQPIFEELLTLPLGED